MIAEEYLKKGNDFYERGDFNSAIENYDQALAINPDYAWAYNNRGLVKSNLGDNWGAITDFDQALAINPDYVKAYYNRGLVKSNLGDKPGAITDYDQALAINPDYAYAYNNRGNAKLALGDKPGAITDYDQALAINPNDARVYYNRGNVKDDLGDNWGAITDYDQSLAINPNNADAYNNRGVVKYCLSKYDEAIKDYNEAIKLNSNDADLYLNRAECYYKLKKIDKAKEDFKLSNKDILEILNFLGEENKSGIIKEGLLNDLLKNDTHYQATVQETDREKYAIPYLYSIYIISMLHINDAVELPVAYYTKKEVADALLVKDEKGNISKFRLNSINYSNDPTEGEVLCEYLFGQKQEKDNTNPVRAFAACFTFNSDCLNHFRLYGKTEKLECTGVSITFNENFFERTIKLATQSLMSEETVSEDAKPKENKQALFRCIYIDPKTRKLISVGHKEDFLFFRENKGDKTKEYNDKIKELTEKVSVELEELKKQCNGLDSAILYQLFINLRYLTKHIAFKEEQECRIVRIKDVKDSKVKVSENRQQMYLEYDLECKNHVKEIVFGPKTSYIDCDRLMHETLIPCRKSDNPFE